MARLDELDFALGAIKRAEHAVDAVAGIAEYFSDSPGVQPLNEEITDSLAHRQTPSRGPATKFPTGPSSAKDVLRTGGPDGSSKPESA